MDREFEAFVLNGHHCPSWAKDIMITLVSRGIMCEIQDREIHLWSGSHRKQKNVVLYIIRHYIDSDLSIWLFCISNSWDTMNLKGKGLKLTSTFNPKSPALTGPYGHGERDG